MTKLKTAIVHDYFFQNGGAEKTVEVMLHEYPESDIFTTLYYPPAFTDCELLTKAWNEGRINTSFMQSLLANKRGIAFFKHFFWLYPFAMKTVVVDGYDRVIVSSTYPAKNVTIKNAGKIISYCHSPSRFLHNMSHQTDMKSINPVLRFFVPSFTWWLKRMDIKAAQNLHKQGAHWFVNATHMKDVVKKAYEIECGVLFPPVDTNHFKSLPKKINLEEPFYLYFGRISFHKKIDLLIEACARTGKRFYVCGGAGLQAETDALNDQINQLDKQFPGTKDRIRLLGRLPDKERDEYIQGATAFLFAGKEDFGIAPIEALASGTPIIMYQAGGALDYLQDGINGVFSPEQTVDSFVNAIKKFESLRFDEQVIRASGERFTTAKFYQELNNVVS